MFNGVKFVKALFETHIIRILIINHFQIRNPICNNLNFFLFFLNKINTPKFLFGHIEKLCVNFGFSFREDYDFFFNFYSEV